LRKNQAEGVNPLCAVAIRKRGRREHASSTRRTRWPGELGQNVTFGALRHHFANFIPKAFRKPTVENSIEPIMIEGTGRNLYFIGKLLLFVAASPAVASSAQTAAVPSVSGPPRPVNAVAAAPPVFEVTTVKLNKSGSSGSDSNLDNGRFTASNILLKNLIQYQAYGIPEPRILGGPKWLNSERSAAVTSPGR
jgi:hypothetical protein